MVGVAEELARNLNLEIIEKISTPSRPERRALLPEQVRQGPLSERLASLLGRADGEVWHHQAVALDHLVKRRNVVVATGTASGKSLIFQLEALRRVLSDPTSKVLVMYPLKALASDQASRWATMVRRAGLPADTVGKIDGDVLMHNRDQVLASARILVATPDICHAWLMRNVGSGPVRRFLESLSLVVLDEAHVYESVFGSNVAYLMRRLIAAKRKATRPEVRPTQMQVLAATATIANPADHLRLLTGLDFAVVDEDQNGAPHFGRQIVHVSGAEYGAAGEAAVIDLVAGILALPQRRRFIVFIDSRQGVERAVRAIGNDGVLPYRSGYEASDRERIETALRDGSLHGVIATSALELGIDIADMEIGVTLGVPQSKKALHQRIGRVGRAKPGTFLVIATPGAFGRLGLTFSEYLQMPVEPSHLYLGNRFIQFSQARCLFEEMEVLGQDRSGLPSGAVWPNGFDEIISIAKPGAARSREFDFINQLGADAPHFNYPLRQVGEGSFDIQEGNRSDPIRVGSIAANQAIREAYPGATYLHAGRAYKVYEWRTRPGDRAIRVGSAANEVPTKPILKKRVNLSLQHDGIINGRFLTNETGLIAEVHVQVNESVEGYKIGKTSRLYRDLRAENPAMSRKQRDFRTTGVILKISEDWFMGSSDDRRRVREQVADGLRDLLSSEYGIAPHDVDSTSTNIGLITASGPSPMTDAVVIYDAVYGSLRLTEALFDAFPTYLARLDRGAALAGAEAFVDDDVANKLCEWSKSLAPAGELNTKHLEIPDGWRLTYRRGSLVCVYSNGVLLERELLGPKMVEFPGADGPILFYRYKTTQGEAFVPHDQIQATGQDWSWELWNPSTGEFQDMDDAA